MNFFTILLTALIISIVAASRLASPQHLQHRALEQHLNHQRSTLHQGLASARPRMLRKRGGRSRDCSGRKKKSSHHPDDKSSGSESSSSGSDSDQSSSSPSSPSNHSPNQSSGKTHSSSSGKSSTKSSGKTESNSSGASHPKSTSNSNTTSSGLAGKTFSGQCKDPNVSAEFPNGDIHFLNCGISKSDKSSKWSPPHLTMKDITVISSEKAAKSSVFKPCSKYKTDFEKAEEQTGIPVVMLMSFAMQESTCNAKETGGNGEIGIMQLTPDKCKGVDCYDAGTNIMMGAKYFKSQVDQFNGNVLEAVGAYNGWSTDMSFSSATNLQWGPCAQNNLDYLNQFFNGWCLGTDGYSKRFLIYNNLANCSG